MSEAKEQKDPPLAAERPKGNVAALIPRLGGAAPRPPRPDLTDEQTMELSRRLAQQHGAIEDERVEVEEPPPPPVQAEVRMRRAPERAVSRLNPRIKVPYDGERVPWSSNLRAELPEYAVEQIIELAHQQRCTIVSVLMNMMAQYTDEAGEKVFVIRAEDCVSDRRKFSKKPR